MTVAMKNIYDRLSPRQARIISHLGSVLLGLIVAVVIHYVLYRIGLPSQPFIYVAF